MNLTETRELLRQRRLLTGAAYNDDTVSAWHDAFKRDPFDGCVVALVAATRTRAGHVMVADIVAHMPPRATADTVHTIMCACGGEGLLSDDVPDNLHPGQLYRVWRPCPGTERRDVPNPGPEMSYEQYLALQRPPVGFDERDHEWARDAARAIVNDADAVPVSATNPLRPLVDQYVRQMR